MNIFQKTYDGEGLYDLDRDISEAMQEDFNPQIAKLPKDEHGFLRGEFKVTIEWSQHE